ncbi:MAG: sugar phosphate isomerase/epimerase [Actinobacteria bacterium]|nr:sugar phosphate isomerase/epimerase [Actinomycetota bacterium]
MSAGLPRFGVHAGLWGFDWTPDAAARTIGSAAAAGYDFIEIPAVDRSVHPPVDTRRALSANGLDAVVSLALSFDDDITSPDPAVAARGEHRLAEAVAFAAEIGATFVGGVVFSAMGRYLRLPTAADRDRSLAAVRRTATLAARDGITVGVEYVNRYESNLLNTAAQTARFVREIDQPNVVVHMDTFHASVEELSLGDAVRDAGPLLGYIHASESHRGRLGTGTIDWRRFADDLRAAGFAGPVTVETFSSAVVGTDAAVDIGLWRPLWEDPSAVAADSLQFLREQFTPVAVTA